MTSIAALIAWNNHPGSTQTLQSLGSLPVAVGALSGTRSPSDSVTLISVSAHWSTQALRNVFAWFDETKADHLLVISGPEAPIFDNNGLRRMITCMNDTEASIIYGDYREIQTDSTVLLHRCIDYQTGSIRDTFHFGPVQLFNGRHIAAIRNNSTPHPMELSFGALYNLRLQLSECGPVIRLPEPLYSAHVPPVVDGSSHFSYVDPRNREYQIEMEAIATTHLKRIGAWIDQSDSCPLDTTETFPVTASIVIPVKNRARTIGDAVKSALSQATDFPFNVIVVDNHSNDGTTDLLASIAKNDSRLIHTIPDRHDLLIGGCWNEAIYSEQCGKYAVQLDSDDIYDGTDVLARIIAVFAAHDVSLVIGSYTTVNFNLEPLPPGLIDHREWTDENGTNNALRIAGLGAPRAYHVPTIRKLGFPNVSYGEDYAAVLRLSRSYRVGRIYDSLYWCRRWDENSDSSLPPETANRYDHYKDRLRSMEISARIRENTNR